MLLPVVGEGLVEGDVLVVGDVVALAHPDGLLAVEVVPLVGDLLDFLGLLLLLGLVLVDLLDLGLVVVLVLVVLVVGDLLLGGLLGVELDGEANELGVLLHQVLEPLLLEVLGHVLLHGEDDAGSAAHGLRVDVLLDDEGTSGLGGPGVDLVVVVLGGDGDLVGDKVGGVETDSELTDHGNVGAGGEGLHEGLGSGLGDGSEVVDEVLLGHSDSGVLNGEGVVGLVGDEPDLHLLLGLEDSSISQGLVPDLVKGIRGITDELPKEDLLVGVEGVDDERQQLVDVGAESEGFGFGHCEGLVI
mmetsp:Transcript_14257/g.26144  ORF Transcript_14257/g.26144 Transcript_14257/m.26144 type:complete len:301 (-) Transcript_14257:13-915(-)